MLRGILGNFAYHMKMPIMHQHIFAIGSSGGEVEAVVHQIFNIARRVADLNYLPFNNTLPVSFYEPKCINKYNSTTVLRLFLHMSFWRMERCLLFPWIAETRRCDGSTIKTFHPRSTRGNTTFVCRILKIRKSAPITRMMTFPDWLLYKLFKSYQRVIY